MKLPDDMHLWDTVREDVKPLPQRRIQTPAIPHRRQAAWQPPALPMFFNPAPQAPLACGDYSGLDGATAQRLRQGRYPIHARLDLHGMTREQAHGAVTQAVQAAYHAGKRCLLVITGKGDVLRESLSSMLNAPDARGCLLAFGHAHALHGGTGAFYLVLKRRR